MNKHQARIALAWAVAHILIVFYTLISPILGPVTFEEALEVALIVAPLMATLTTSVVKYVMNPAAKPGNRSLSRTARAFSYLFPAAFVLIIGTLLTVFIFDIRPLRFQTLKQIIGVVEVSIGTYVGIVFARLFPSHEL